MMDQPSLNDLPNELLQKVFSWLPTRDMVKCALYVCKRWNRLFCFQSLWRGKLPYEVEEEKMAEEAYQIARIMSSIQTLTLEWNYGFRLEATENAVAVQWVVFQQDKFEFLAYNANIENLTIPGCFLVWSNVTSLARCLPQLKSLTVDNSAADWPSTELPDALERLFGSGLLQNLCKLSVTGASSQSVELGMVLKAASEGCPRLEELQLEYTDRFSERGLTRLDSFIHLRRIRLLSVKSQMILEYLPAGLEELKITSCPDIELNLLRKGCYVPPKLRSLTLESCDLVGQQIEVVAPYMTTLEEVNLSGNRNLADLTFLYSWKQLKSLNLSNCNKFVGGAFEILGFLKHLKVLNLNRCNLENNNLDVIGTLVSLQELYLARTSISQGDALAARLPIGLQVLDVSQCSWVNASIVWELHHLRQLKTLLLSGCGNITGWNHLAIDILPCLSALESLDLSGIGTTSGESLQDLSFLRFCPQLLKLDVGENGGMQGTAFIDLKYVPTLQHLNLNRSNLQNFPFCETLGQLKQLKRLVIHGCTGFGEDVVRRLCRLLPKLKIEGRPCL